MEVEAEAEAEAVGEAGDERRKYDVGNKELNFLLVKLEVLLIGGNSEGYLHMMLCTLRQNRDIYFAVKLSNCRRIVCCNGDYLQFCLVIII